MTQAPGQQTKTLSGFSKQKVIIMRAIVLIQLKQFLKKYEGVCDFMYLDKKKPKGLVTTGIGNLIDPKHLAYSYRWLRRSDNRPASRKEVEREWDRIKSLENYKVKKNGKEVMLRMLGGGHFKRFSSLKLAPGEIDRIFAQKANLFNNQLKKAFPQWDTFPNEAQIAMLIHAWANGTARLKTGWPKYHKACSSNDWKTAANECGWGTIELSRLRHMQQLFRDAAKKNRRPKSAYHNGLVPLPRR